MEELVQAILKEVMKRITKQDDIVVIGKMDGLNNIGNISFVEYSAQMQAERVLVTNLDISSLAQLAIGSASTEQDRFILETLLNSKQVFILESAFEYRKYTNNTLLYSHYLSCEEKLKQFGVNVISSVDQIYNMTENTHINSEKTATPVLSSNAVDLTNIKLLRDSDVISISRGASINIKRTCIITPLAKDTIRSNNLKIIRI
ncbi:MAG: hypothetical protein BEN19_06600 [Epulopiscium sp. Nuni2H_MBin003]|nr:MAG: hypothetical protein BEN19_06600 [Epulopiscium sp. Nuni2H_MBin003]